MLTFIPLSPGAQHPLRTAWDTVAPDVLRVAAGFSTESGAGELRSGIIGAAHFDAADKQFLIGIQEGVTQPDALRRLQGFAASTVRVPFGRQALASPTLRAPTFFHPKLYYLENTATGEAQLLSASANLTYRGLRASVEQFLAWSGTRTDSEATRFKHWWDRLWAQSDVATTAFIQAYEAQRPLLPTPAHAITTGPPNADLQAATEFWIELTRRPEGGSLNQVELLFNGHFFFYPRTAAPRQSVHRPLTFEDRAGIIYNDPGRRIMFNGPPLKPGGNHMWRIYMPTAAMGFIGYQDGDAVVHFTRTRRRDHYLIEVAPARSPQALSWLGTARGISLWHGTPPRRMGWA